MILGDNFCFIHVPKCAGSSLTNMFRDRHDIRVKDEPHSCAQDIPKALRDELFIWGFIRHPIEQEVSNWRYHAFSWDLEPYKEDGFTFEDWVRWRYTEDKDGPSAQLVKPDNRDYGWRLGVGPQAGFFCDEKGDCIANAIYRFENLTDVLMEVSDKIGLDVTLDNTNHTHRENVQSWSTGNETYRKWVTPWCEEVLSERRALDFTLWGGTQSIVTNYNLPVKPDYGFSRP